MEVIGTAVVFFIVLLALIVVHELGHFFAAKWSGMKVEEFGIGLPPRATTFAHRNGTAYTLNWLPIGGFVKIKGEDGDAQGADSFSSRPHHLQAFVVLAGILMNLLFAWVLLSTTLALGMPRALSADELIRAPDASLMVSQVVAGSPAETAGLKPGDTIKQAYAGDHIYEGKESEGFSTFVSEHTDVPITLLLMRGEEELMVSAVPTKGIIMSAPERAALGVGLVSVGTIPVSLLEAPIEGAAFTWSATQQVGIGLIAFFGSLFTGAADLSQVSGPLGIAGAVGDASHQGLISLLTLTAVISINLALINLLPIPALDGGRLVFVLIEWVTRKRIPDGVAGMVNAAGFALLLLLMFVVTVSDVAKLFT